jgi:hypothetical protein
MEETCSRRDLFGGWATGNQSMPLKTIGFLGVVLFFHWEEEFKIARIWSATILDLRGAWDEAKLNEVFYEVDVADILRTPIVCAGSGDVMAWNHTKSGLFSVKSSYHLAVKRKRESRGNTGSSNSCSEHQGWLALWAAQVPGKMKVHVWRLVENGLAVGSELSHRKIKDGVYCLACGRTEILVHHFWLCPHSAQAWTLLSEKTCLRWEPPPKRLACNTDGFSTG